MTHAAIGGHHCTVQLLVLSGANIDHRDNTGKTSLYLAAALNQSSIVLTLTISKANANIEDNWGRTALMRASWLFKVSEEGDVIDCGFRHIMQMLISRGADLNHRDVHGMTALIHAAIWKQKFAMWMLVDCGADQSIRDEFGNTADDYDGDNRLELMYNGVPSIMQLYLRDLRKMVHSERSLPGFNDWITGQIQIVDVDETPTQPSTSSSSTVYEWNDSSQ